MHYKYSCFQKIFIAIAISLPIFLWSCGERKPDYHSVLPGHTHFQYTGRFDFSQNNKARFAWTGSSISFAFKGANCTAIFKNLSDIKDGYGKLQSNFFDVTLDGKHTFLLETTNDSLVYPLVSNLKDTVHTIQIFKRTEAACGTVEFHGLRLDTGDYLIPIRKPYSRKIEFIGNSITCGYGNEGDSARCKFTPKTENGNKTFSAITARNLKAEYVAIAMSGKGMVQNYNRENLETMPRLYERILPGDSLSQWNFSSWIPDAVVINLGTNDFAHENPDRVFFVSAYKNFLKRIRKNYPDKPIFCLTSPMVSDAYPKPRKVRTTLSNYIKNIIVDLEKEGYSKIYWHTLSEQGKLGLGCDFHPNLRQHKANADELTSFIRKKLGW